MKKVHVALVLDKSGSMHGTRDHTISGFNEQVGQIEINAKEAVNIETTVTLVTFNGNVYEHLLAAPVDQLEEADPKFYECDGGTALRDAIGYTIRKLEEIAGPEDDVLITTISDGGENGSTHYSEGLLKEEVESLQKTGHWTFAYMGCTASMLEQVNRTTGIPVSNMAAWSNQTGGASKRAMVGTAGAVGRFLLDKSASPDKAMVSNLYSEKDDECMDYTASAEGTGVKLSDAVAAENGKVFSEDVKGLLGVAARGRARHARSYSNGAVGQSQVRGLAASPELMSLQTSAPAPEVEDRPEDLQLRVGTSDVFAKGNKASW